MRELTGIVVAPLAVAAGVFPVTGHGVYGRSVLAQGSEASHSARRPGHRQVNSEHKRTTDSCKSKILFNQTIYYRKNRAGFLI